eukprot:GHVU01178029.1.p1 GENE.GHVU01178029.1~~GHVU01178029.1.p1  ORF type:complete len:251 (+),score=24.54 GHVU01178029.1:238-990(+)
MHARSHHGHHGHHHSHGQQHHYVPGDKDKVVLGGRAGRGGDYEAYNECRIQTRDFPVFIQLRGSFSSKADEAGHPCAGTAEMFGAELVSEVDYEVPPHSNVAVFSWGDCELEVREGGLGLGGPTGTGGDTASYQRHEYDNTAHMTAIINLAAALHAQRLVAKANKEVGPRVLIVGSKSSGKTTVARILLNYAVRQGWTPLYVDLDDTSVVCFSYVRIYVRMHMRARVRMCGRTRLSYMTILISLTKRFGK